MMQVLLPVRHTISKSFDLTYMPPRPKTSINAIFCRFGKFRLLNTGNGRTAVPTSVTMLMAAFENL